MWTQLQTLMRQLSGERGDAAMFDDFQLALAGLLVRVAAIDGAYLDAEHERLKAVLQKRFELSPEIAGELSRAGRLKEQEAVDIYGFTRVLTKALDQEGRQEVVEMLWEIAFADGEVHEYESNLLWRASELLGVDRADRLRLRDEMRRRTEAKRAAE
ncbi:MAG: hypothetical protein C0605_13435 [Hyphomicrobiales bacterium]|nr:MAG: hypothetical protein C0605_13435 [Hyphomicrobiales bacterium]